MEITDGYSLICPNCFARYGENKSGVRELDLIICKDCIKKLRLEKDERDRINEQAHKEGSKKRQAHFVKLKQMRELRI